MKRWMFFYLSAIVLAFLCHVSPAMAQQVSPTGPFARIVVLEPKPGQRDAFVAGYERHIEWHRRENDPWTWYGWSFVLGERIEWTALSTARSRTCETNCCATSRRSAITPDDLSPTCRKTNNHG